MSRPVEPKNRIPAEKIELSRVTEDDLIEIVSVPALAMRSISYSSMQAAGLHSSFPEVWWEKHDPIGKRPPHEVRTGRLAKRLHPWLWLSGNHGV